MSNVRIFTGITPFDMPPDQMLEAAIGALDSVIIIGYAKDGEEFFSSSLADGGDVLWLLERTKSKLLSIPEDR